jgi:hypothetical protein
VPDAKTQFKVVFNMVKAIEDTAVIGALIERAKAEVEKAIESAGAINEESEAAPAVEGNPKY